MTNTFPTRNQLKCAGCSFIIAQTLFIIGVLMFSIDYDLYSVDNEEKVIELHNLLSSSEHRTQIEIGVSLMWISFPFLLIALNGVKSVIEPAYQGTGGTVLVYLAEKSFIMFIAVATIIVPAISLSSVSFEWSFHEYTPDADFIPTGYYIQLYSNILTLELIDCLSIADATFMVSIFLLPRFIIGDNARFRKIKSILDPDLPKCLQDLHCCIKCVRITLIGFALSCFVIFCIVLFEFAESGFFSPTGYAKFLVAWSIILKFLIGVRMFHMGHSKSYDAIKQVFEGKDDIILESGGDSDNYKMEKITRETNDKKENTVSDGDAQL